ncbi:MAG: HEAT repeat domain-containing protein, partial [Acidobacteria bacterium]|nr:HEAT repeat domain-containing protein [Acidobacteriota bacterium]
SIRYANESVEQLSLSYLLSSLPPPSDRSVVFVFGLDDLPTAQRDIAINALNWGRERLRWTGYSIVLWVRPRTPSDIGNKAPDFFSWRSNVFEFDIPANQNERKLAIAKLKTRSANSLGNLRQLYCAYILRTYEWVSYRGILQLRNVIKLPLENIFVPLNVVVGPSLHPRQSELLDDIYGSSEWEIPSNYSPEQRVSFNKIISQYKRVVILGDPGAGKSTVLRYLAVTFAKGKLHSHKVFNISEDLLPIIVPLNTFSETLRKLKSVSINKFLTEYYIEQGLPDLSNLFEESLINGRALLLLDGLDEMLDPKDRTAVAHSVLELTRSFPNCRIIITSRIAGFVHTTLESEFITTTLEQLNEPEIETFVNKWSLAFESIGLANEQEISPDVRRRAELRAQNLSAAITSHEGVRKLAKTPLLLTLLALIHYQGTRLPSRRVDLYRLCVEALVETWNLARSLTGRPIDLRLGERHLDDEFVIRILGPIAYNLMEINQGLVKREELELRIVDQLIKHEDLSQEGAAELAHDFIILAREQMGLLVERSPNEFGFVHLTFQEYFAARYLSERMNAFDFLKPHLHQSRWHEVILLTAGCLRGDYSTAFVENILNAHTPFNLILEKISRLKDERTENGIVSSLMSISDMLLAVRCAGDNVQIPSTMLFKIHDVITELWIQPPFIRLRSELTGIMGYTDSTILGTRSRNFLLQIVEERTCEPQTLIDAVSALGREWGEDVKILDVLKQITVNHEASLGLRRAAATALGNARANVGDINQFLLDILWGNIKAPLPIRRSAAVALGRVAQDDVHIKSTLVNIIRDKKQDVRLLVASVDALANMWLGEKEISKALLNILRDGTQQIGLRRQVAAALNRAGQDDGEAIYLLLQIVQDRTEDPYLRMNAAFTLGQIAQGDNEVLVTLLNIVQDKSDVVWARRGAAGALGYMDGNRGDITKALVEILLNRQEKKYVRRMAVFSLRQREPDNPQTEKLFLTLLKNRQESHFIIRGVIIALRDIGTNRDKILRSLIQTSWLTIFTDIALDTLWEVLKRETGR